MPDGRVAFIDFGMTKRVSAEDVAAEVEAVRLAMEGDAVGLHRQLARHGLLRPLRRGGRRPRPCSRTSGT